MANLTQRDSEMNSHSRNRPPLPPSHRQESSIEMASIMTEEVNLKKDETMPRQIFGQGSIEHYEEQYNKDESISDIIDKMKDLEKSYSRKKSISISPQK